jgi:transposase InsO family protein
MQRVGRDEVARRTGVPPRTVSRILARHDRPPLAWLDPTTGQLIRASRSTALRYERDAPGDLIHIDVKKLGRIPDGGGWRTLGRAATGHHRDKKDKIGFDYVHAAVDDHSRLAYAEVLPDERGTTAAGFLLRAAGFFAGHGIPIREVITDNAFAYRHSVAFRDAVGVLGAKQRFIKPHCPWQNGKVERLNRTLQAEWAYRQPFTSNSARAAALDPWLEHYNTQRAHTALGGHPPISRAPSPT